MGFIDNFKKKWKELDEAYREDVKISKARRRGINEAEAYTRCNEVTAELEYRISSVIRQLKERNGDPDLIERLEIRRSNGAYDYEDLLDMYGYNVSSFNIKKISPEDIWDPGRDAVVEKQLRHSKYQS